MEQIRDFIVSLGYSHKEATIWLALFQLNASPASSVARQAGYERIYTYKILQKMVDDGIVSQTKKGGTIHFLIPDESLILSYIKRHREKRNNLETKFVYIQTALQEFRQKKQTITPKIELYEGFNQISNLFEDIQQTIRKYNLLSIRVFGTHTFQEQIISDRSLGDIAQGFIRFLDEKHIQLSNHIAEGGLIMEQLRQYPGSKALRDLPAGDNAINILLTGEIVYVIIYKGDPIGIKISSPELTRALNFLLKSSEKN